MKGKSLFVLALAAASLLYSCNGRNNSDKVYSVDELSAVIESLNSGDTLSVRGFCTDVCGHGSSHITLAGEDSTNAIAGMAGESLGAFSDDIKYQYVTVTGILDEQKVDTVFLNDWERRLDESLEGPNGNPEAVAQLKEQIVMLRDSIAARNQRCGKNYWSNYSIIVSSYSCDE